jgi:uncharacterized protein (DUF1778 family)
VSTKLKQGQSDRVNLRINPSQKARLTKAAQASGRSFSEFVLASALTNANDILADRTTFVLSPKDWRKFNELLDSPPRDTPRLRRLFREKSVFENS